MLYSASASAKNTWRDHISCFGHFDRDTDIVMLTIQKKGPNTSRKCESVPFGLHNSQRVVCLCHLTVATTDIMYWETGNKKITKSELSIYMLFCCNPWNSQQSSFPVLVPVPWFRNNGTEKQFSMDIFSLADQKLFDERFFSFLVF